MELVEGETLEARVRRSGPLPPALALEVITQAARALVTLEAHGLVHRDLKPANLMLVEGSELTIKVIDFGLVKAAATPGVRATLLMGVSSVRPLSRARSNSITPAWSPFRLVFIGYRAVEMLTGQTPFRGTPGEVMHQHQHASFRSICSKLFHNRWLFYLRYSSRKTHASLSDRRNF
jgi:serine/threonine protein kinase